MNADEKRATGSEPSIVDNRDRDSKVLRYLHGGRGSPARYLSRHLGQRSRLVHRHGLHGNRPIRRELCVGGRTGMIATVKSRQRIIDYGEVFTPPRLVNDMLDLVAHECERIESRFLEPACGNGNFLAEVLRRKLLTVDKRNARNRDKWERDAILSVCSLYGIDLLADNVEVCRDRLLSVLCAAYEARFKVALPEKAVRAATYILSRNILQGDAISLLMENGRPIVFSEWTPINGQLLKRKTFVYQHLLGHADNSSAATAPLFSELGEDVYYSKPIRDYPPCHYLKVADAEGENERP